MTEDLDNSDYYINREFSALAFNAHVLHAAMDERTPLLERLRFLFIVSSNLDEFFEIRVAGIKETIALNAQKLSIDGLAPKQVFAEISHKAHRLITQLYQVFNQQLLPQLAKQGIHFVRENQWSEEIQRWAKRYFKREILPILSPIGLDLAHPFPRLINKSLNFIISLSGKDAFGRNIEYAIVHAPRSLPRAICLPQELGQGKNQFIYLSSIIKTHVHTLFPGMEISGCYPFRLTRNSDFFLHEEEIEDLAQALKSELFSRHYGHSVRLEIDNQCPHKIVDFLLQKHHLTHDDVYYCDGPVNLRSYMNVINSIDNAQLKYPEFPSQELIKENQDLFAALSQKDILLHHPYQSFNTVINFIKQAASDPEVLAIKQTLYRTHSESVMVKTLIEAAQAGKEVTAVIELRARFDEASNLKLADRLQQAGVLVVYGVVGFKAHAKMTLVVRREGSSLKRYVHLGTGNYHERTAKLYTDIGLLTSNKEIARDTQIIFHQLTGLGKTIPLKQLFYSPFTLQKKLLKLIEQAAKAQSQGETAKIIIKVNGLTDKKIIKALYKASQAGVKIHLVVRTLCCLRPGIPGVSENIKVTSIIGRFLEHHRTYYFKIGNQESIYCASADLMERNLYSRIEIMFPILDADAKQRIKTEIINNYIKDNKNCWVMSADGNYKLHNKGQHSAQQYLLNQFCINQS